MIKIKVIGKDNIGWSIDKDRSNLIYFLEKLDTVQIVDSYLKADIFFFVWLDLVKSPKYFFPILLRVFKKVKIISWVTNDITQKKNFSKRWTVDLFISPSSRVSKFLNELNLKNVQIPFFVSGKIYKNLNKSRTDLSSELNIPINKIEGKFLIGSFQRDSLGEDLNKPKWQKDPDLLIKICKSFPKNKFCLVLAGPRRHYVINKCRENNIPYIFVGDESFVDSGKDDIFINNLSEEKINNLYNLVDLYLVTSKSEGGPKAIMEASFAETMIFSTDVGLAGDFLHPDLVTNIGEISSEFFMGMSKDKILEYKNYNYEKTNSILSENNYSALIKDAILKIE